MVFSTERFISSTATVQVNGLDAVTLVWSSFPSFLGVALCRVSAVSQMEQVEE